MQFWGRPVRRQLHAHHRGYALKIDTPRTLLAEFPTRKRRRVDLEFGGQPLLGPAPCYPESHEALSDRLGFRSWVITEKSKDCGNPLKLWLAPSVLPEPDRGNTTPDSLPHILLQQTKVHSTPP